MPTLSTVASRGLLFMMLVLPAVLAEPAAAADSRGSCVDSPRAVITVCVNIDARGPYYDVHRGTRRVIRRSSQPRSACASAAAAWR